MPDKRGGQAEEKGVLAAMMWNGGRADRLHTKETKPDALIGNEGCSVKSSRRKVDRTAKVVERLLLDEWLSAFDGLFVMPSIVFDRKLLRSARRPMGVLDGQPPRPGMRRSFCLMRSIGVASLLAPLRQGRLSDRSSTRPRKNGRRCFLSQCRGR